MNDDIRAKEVRVIGPAGENYGILPLREAVAKAREHGLDLIEVSANANPPVCRITDYGKFKYELKKKDKEVKAKARVTETKEAQVKIGTSQNDMNIKAGKIGEWLREGHRVKIDLFLWGRYKYMEFSFLKERLERFLAIVPESYKIADEIKKSPKGLSVVIERDPASRSASPKASKDQGKATQGKAPQEAPAKPAPKQEAANEPAPEE